MAGLQVLHVDDEADMRLLVKLSLDLDDGISTRSAATGEEALEVTAAWRPDVILLDAAMPGMDGLATLRALQANPKTAGIPVVFLTARCEDSDVDSFVAHGSAGVIAKPFDVRGLASAIRTHAASGGQPSGGGALPAPTLPDFIGRGAARSGVAAPAGTAGTTRALLLDGKGGAFALTVVETGASAAGQPVLHDHAHAWSLDVTPLDRPTLASLLGMDAAIPLGGTSSADLSGTTYEAAAGSVGRAAGCDPMTIAGATSPVGGSAAPLTFGAAFPGTPSDWLAGLLPRGLLH